MSEETASQAYDKGYNREMNNMEVSSCSRCGIGISPEITYDWDKCKDCASEAVYD